MRDELHHRDKQSKLRNHHKISKIVNSFKNIIQKELDSLEFDILIKTSIIRSRRLIENVNNV